MQRLVAAALFGGLLVAASPAGSHHSAAMYDRDKTITVQGVVKSWQFSNPHTWLEVVAADPAGGEKVWGFESSGASGLMRAGIKRNTFLPGEKISVRTHPLKDGRPGGQFIDATKADGTVIGREGV